MEKNKILALESWLREALDAETVYVQAPSKMPGGAVQENWRLDVEVSGGPHAGSLPLVLRTDAPSGVSISLSRVQEFGLLKAAFEVGVTVPEPLAMDTEGAALRKPAYVMRRVAGTANPRRLARDDALGPYRPAITEALGHELARIHSIKPGHAGLDFLPLDDRPPARRRIDEFQEQLDVLPDAYPVLEYGIRWLHHNAPEALATVLGHGDFRCGNVMINPEDGGRITAILDWEFSGWSDPMEDVGWLCARCWRFGCDGRQVGGIGDLEDFIRGYEAEAGHSLDWETLPFWETVATIRWAIIARHQGQRHLSGDEFSMELALTGRKAAEMEYDVLADIRRIEKAKKEGI